MKQTILDIALDQAQRQPSKSAYNYLDDKADVAATLSFGGLDAIARTIALRLGTTARRGDRALLVFPPGIDFVKAFYGCIYAGIIPVPCHPPNPGGLQQSHPRFWSLAQDCNAAVVMTVRSMIPSREQLDETQSPVANLNWLAIDEIATSDASEWRHPGSLATDITLIQYTSGSTSSPKGVMLTNANILGNCRLIYEAYRHDANTHLINWLPLYHDMGLIGSGVLQSMLAGATSDLMSPVSFMRKPTLWLEAISRRNDCRVTSGGPNFSYESCLVRANAEEIQHIDLSGWAVAFNGAEPIRSEVMHAFATAFAPKGFRASSLFPCYGLAEATLMVAGGPHGRPLEEANVSLDELLDGRLGVPASEDKGRNITLVSSGRTLQDQVIRIVDSESRRPKPDGEIGEIWVRGVSVGEGYWKQPEASAETFRAVIDREPGVHYLRTGDLGAIVDGELYVTGRIKDVLIIDGLNVYPHDVEFHAERSHQSLRPGACVAFNRSGLGEAREQIVVVAEVQPRALALLQRADDAATALRDEIQLNVYRAVKNAIGISIAELILVRPRTVPRTTSGKLQRLLCRQLHASGEILPLHELA